MKRVCFTTSPALKRSTHSLGKPVASGPPGFLVIALDVLRQVVVDDEADVRLVDPHPEGDRRAHHPDVVAQEHLLVLRALVRFQAGVIRLRRDAVGVQLRGDASRQSCGWRNRRSRCR